jgi:hypothetical protein
MRFVVTLGDGSECYTQGFVDVTLSSGSNLKFSVRLHIIEASSFDFNLGDDWQMDACVNSGYGYYMIESGISKGIEIPERKFFMKEITRKEHQFIVR